MKTTQEQIALARDVVAKTCKPDMRACYTRKERE